jgi:uncharacterized protein (DUF433 family)
MIATEPTAHVRIDRRGVAWIDDTNVKVVEVMQDHLAYGHGAEEIHLQHPGLSLAQVHAAFAYYYDHQRELDAELVRRHRRVESIRTVKGGFPSRKTLVARLKRK